MHAELLVISSSMINVG